MGLLILIVVLALGCLIYYSKINIKIQYQRMEKHDKGEIKLSGLGGLVHYRLSIPTVDFKDVDKGVKVESNQETATKQKEKETFITKDKLETWYENYEDLLQRITLFQESVRWFMARIHCEKWVWKTMVGTGDAAEAGVLTGVVWGVKANMLGFISHYIQWDSKPQIEVTPSFQQAVLDTSFVAKFSFTLGSCIRFFLILWFRSRGRSGKSQVVSSQRASNL